MENWNNNNYEKCLRELHGLIPSEDKRRIMSQNMCEYEHDFMGFLNVYKPLSELIPKDKIVIDFGCYLAAQSYFFKEHKKYIGVDVCELERFNPGNAEHYVCTIQDFIKNGAFGLLSEEDNLSFFAICSYVPDFAASELVRRTFRNVCCYYPGGSE